MIQIITGVPGGGKSYNAVSRALKLLEDGQIVVHNIHGFNDERAIQWDFGQIPLDADSLFKAFDLLRVQRGVSPETIITVFIDEAQRYWPYEFKDPRGVFFFDYHRHHGLDIFLITQDIKKISPKISTLAEMEIRAIKPMFQITPGFTYNLISGGEIFGKERLPKKAEIFQAYTSFLAGKGSQKKSMYRWGIPFMICFTLIMYFVLNFALKNSFSSLSPQKEISKQSESLKKDSISSSPIQSSGRDLGAGVSTDDAGIPDVKYMAPHIKKHKGMHVTFTDPDDEFDKTITFDDFKKRFPPDLYGYSYIAVPSKDMIVIMDRYTNEYLYPIENKVARTVNYVKDAPKQQNDYVYPDPLAHYPEAPISRGYSIQDKRLLAYFLDVARGISSHPPSDSGKTSSIPNPVTNSTLIAN